MTDHEKNPDRRASLVGDIQPVTVRLGPKGGSVAMTLRKSLVEPFGREPDRAIAARLDFEAAGCLLVAPESYNPSETGTPQLHVMKEGPRRIIIELAHAETERLTNQEALGLDILAHGARSGLLPNVSTPETFAEVDAVIADLESTHGLARAAGGKAPCDNQDNGPDREDTENSNPEEST